MEKKSFDPGVFGGLILVCIFVLCMFLTLAAGALIYEDISGVMEEQYTVRTAVSYLATRARQGNAAGEISTGNFDGESALVLTENGDDGTYVTYIYCWNGYIRELYCPEGEELLVTDGETVIAADDVNFTVDDGLLKIECTTNGKTAVQYIGIASGEGESA
jgi:hypothetical protein